MNANCICCLSDGAHTPQGATTCALAAVVGLGINQVITDLCVRHREIVNAAVRHAKDVTASGGLK